MAIDTGMGRIKGDEKASREQLKISNRRRVMKHILFTIHSMPIGGAEKVLLDILNHFDYSKYTVDLLLYQYWGENLAKIPTVVNVLSVFPPQKRTITNRIYSRFLNVTGLITALEKYKTRKVIGDNYYDTIISFCQGPGHKMHTFLLDKGSKHISWVHTDLSLENWGKLFFNNDILKQEEAYNKMHEIIHVSNGVKDAFNSVFNIKSNINQRVIYNIVDTQDILLKSSLHAENIKSSHSFVFVNSGRIVSQKKQVRLIEAANILAKRGYDFEIWILGDGPLRSELEDHIKALKMEDYVKLLGFIDNPYPYIKHADSFVLTSSQEGFSIVVCEALVLGKPIISTRVVGPIELLGESEYGLLVSENITDITHAMEKFIKSESLRKQYSLASLERSKMFNTEHTMDEIYSLFNK